VSGSEEAPLTIPETPAELTAEWLTAALRRGGVLEDQNVVGVEAEVLGEGVGFMGDLLRLALTYDGPGSSPASLIAKLPKLENRAMGEMLGAYERENCFYMEMAGSLPLRTPRMYYGDFDRDRASEKQEEILRLFDRMPRFLLGFLPGLGRRIAAAKKRRYILLLEDLSDAEPGDQVAGVNVERCERALRSIARAHAACWGADLVDAFWLLPHDIDARMRHSMFKNSRSAFSDVFGAELEERLAPYLRPLPEQGLDMVRRLNQAPTTLLHCDLRLDNLFFRDDEVIVIDWQLVRRGPAVYDVAYFLSSALDQAAGRTVVEGLLAAYMEELRAGGVGGYTMDDLLRDYRLALQVVLMTLSTVDQVDLGDGRGIDLMRGWISRLHGRLTEMGEPG
jgi:hypothetical protein